MTSKTSTDAAAQPYKKVGGKDWFHSVFWGIAFIYAGLLFFLLEWDVLYEDQVFPLLFFGLGLLMVVDYFVRYYSQTLRNAGIAKLIFGLIFIIGASHHLYYTVEWWPILLIIAGLWIIWSGKRHAGEQTQQPTEPPEPEQEKTVQ